MKIVSTGITVQVWEEPFLWARSQNAFCRKALTWWYLTVLLMKQLTNVHSSSFQEYSQMLGFDHVMQPASYMAGLLPVTWQVKEHYFLLQLTRGLDPHCEQILGGLILTVNRSLVDWSSPWTDPQWIYPHHEQILGGLILTMNRSLVDWSWLWTDPQWIASRCEQILSGFILTVNRSLLDWSSPWTGHQRIDPHYSGHFSGHNTTFLCSLNSHRSILQGVMFSSWSSITLTWHPSGARSLRLMRWMWDTVRSWTKTSRWEMPKMLNLIQRQLLFY